MDKNKSFMRDVRKYITKVTMRLINAAAQCAHIGSKVMLGAAFGLAWNVPGLGAMVPLAMSIENIEHIYDGMQSSTFNSFTSAVSALWAATKNVATIVVCVFVGEAILRGCGVKDRDFRQVIQCGLIPAFILRFSL